MIHRTRGQPATIIPRPHDRNFTGCILQTFRPWNVFRHKTDEAVGLWHHQQAANVCAMVLYRLVWCMCTGNALYRPKTAGEQLQSTAGIHSVTQRELTLVRDTGTYIIYTNVQIFISPAIMAYTFGRSIPQNVFKNVLLWYTMSASVLFKTYQILYCYICLAVALGHNRVTITVVLWVDHRSAGRERGTRGVLIVKAAVVG